MIWVDDKDVEKLQGLSTGDRNGKYHSLWGNLISSFLKHSL